MGDENAKQEEVKSETKTEEKAEEKKTAEEEKKEEEKKPPSPVVLFVDLHCVGCSKKIERTLMKVRGVEGIAINMGLNQVTVKGVVDPQALCALVQKKTRRRASILSPLPAPEGEPTPQFVTSQVSEITTVELNVDMHCEACAQQLKRKILKMRGVQTAETDLGSSKVTVTGTMDAQRLIDYVYRRTRKQARVVPQPQPEPEPKKEEEKKDEGEKPAAAPEEAAKAEENKEENATEKKEEEKPPEPAPAAAAAATEEEKKEGGNNSENKESETKVDGQKVEESKPQEDQAVPKQEDQELINEERIAKMMYYYQPLYVIERIPPPQLFSDENPNACCIS